jgi:hypothetical protein
MIAATLPAKVRTPIESVRRDNGARGACATGRDGALVEELVERSSVVGVVVGMSMSCCSALGVKQWSVSDRVRTRLRWQRTQFMA